MQDVGEFHPAHNMMTIHHHLMSTLQWLGFFELTGGT
jgi:hypothetical protein